MELERENNETWIASKGRIDVLYMALMLVL